MKSSFFSTFGLVLVLSAAVFLGFWLSLQRSQIFSTESLETLKVLNFEHQMLVDDLRTVDRSVLLSELATANALIPAPLPQPDYKGFIVRLDPSLTEGGILLFQPVKPLSDVSLLSIAEEYQAQVPEFETVELDQAVALESSIELSDESVAGENEATLLGLEGSEFVPSDPIQIAIIDSGLDPLHEVFLSDQLGTGWNTILDNTEMYDDVGHGTHIAGIVAAETEGVVEIIPYKIVDAKGGKLSNVLEALSLAIQAEVQVVNMSFGVTSPSYALEALVEEAYEKNIILVAAAGNNASDHNFYPAEYEPTIAVASVDRLGNKMPNSNYGSWVDLAAPGQHVRSALPSNNYGYKSGTSQATAKITARIATLLQYASSNESWTSEAVLSGLQARGILISDGELAGVSRIE